MKKQHGLTLIELVVTVTLIIIISSYGIPKLNNVMKSNRLTGQINRLVTDLAYARTEAIKRTSTVTITAVNAANWNQGWTISTVDLNGNNVNLKTATATPGSTLSNGGIGAIQFSSDGRTGATITFNLCDDTWKGNNGKRVTLNTTGQTYLETQITCA